MNSFRPFSNSSEFFWNSFDFLEIVLNCLGIVLRFLGTALAILWITLGSSQRHQIKRPRQPLIYIYIYIQWTWWSTWYCIIIHLYGWETWYENRNSYSTANCWQVTVWSWLAVWGRHGYPRVESISFAVIIRCFPVDLGQPFWFGTITMFSQPWWWCQFSQSWSLSLVNLLSPARPPYVSICGQCHQGSSVGFGSSSVVWIRTQVIEHFRRACLFKHTQVQRLRGRKVCKLSRARFNFRLPSSKKDGWPHPQLWSSG